MRVFSNKNADVVISDCSSGQLVDHVVKPGENTLPNTLAEMFVKSDALRGYVLAGEFEITEAPAGETDQKRGKKG